MRSSVEMQTGPRVVVVPRPLEAFFFARLRQHYADREDVRVVVDRRHSERRRADRGPGRLPERRSGERRVSGPTWSLQDMPVRTAG